MIERVVLASSNPGDLVLDPFMGSGTTAAVALKHGRMVVGFEIRADYCKIAIERMRAAEGEQRRVAKPSTKSMRKAPSRTGQ